MACFHRCTDAGTIQEEETGSEAAFGVLVAEECFYLAGWEARFKAVIKTKNWRETASSVSRSSVKLKISPNFIYKVSRSPRQSKQTFPGFKLLMDDR